MAYAVTKAAGLHLMKCIGESDAVTMGHLLI